MRLVGLEESLWHLGEEWVVRKEGRQIRSWCNRPGESWLNNVSFPNTYACGLLPRTRQEKKRGGDNHNQPVIIYLLIFLAALTDTLGTTSFLRRNYKGVYLVCLAALFPGDLPFTLGPGFSLLMNIGWGSLDFIMFFLWQRLLPGVCLKYYHFLPPGLQTLQYPC